MKVLKFGGASIGSHEGVDRVKEIVLSQQEDVIVVVSALSDVTDELYRLIELAAHGELEQYEQGLVRLEERHFDLAHYAVLPERKEVVEKGMQSLFADLGNILRGVYLIRDVSERITDTIVSYGERCAALMVANMLSGAKHYEAMDIMRTECQFGKHVVDFEETNSRIRGVFGQHEDIAVLGGFIAKDRTTENITNLGRGGSDYTAAVVAAALNASCLEIWTDVDGFMTADPTIVDTAYTIEELNFTEAMELCNFGVRVIYPPTIFPVYHKNIPIRIKNTFNPTAKGTYISAKTTSDPERPIKGISSINDMALLTVQGLGMVGIIGVNYRIFRALAKNGISVFLVSQASSENNTSIGIRPVDGEKAIRVLREEFAHEMAQGEISNIFTEDGLATVAVVGGSMRHMPGIAGKLFGTLGRNGINVVACAQGAQEINISFVVKKESLRKALNVIHDSFFLSEYQVLNLFVIGVGTVGSSLIEQLRQQHDKLMESKRLKINVVGVASSNKLLTDSDGLPLDTCISDLRAKGFPSTPVRLADEVIGMNIFNSVVVDCTASADVAALYPLFLQHNISVVAANKIAASSDYAQYAQLKEYTRTHGVKFLFETNVGAGLPIINTMNSLINSGDTILKIEAVLSGTLNYIFNTISEDVTLSKAIRMAQEAGFSEPDPRIDLSGKDVVRKLVILAREAGYRIEQSDVRQELFLPENCFIGSLDEFWERVPALDETFERRRKQLAVENKCWRFVASMERGVCKVGLEEIEEKHPFYDLQGSNNIILLTTERYKEYPMVIKGYGAGASVTAAGVFADIISIANIR